MNVTGALNPRQGVFAGRSPPDSAPARSGWRVSPGSQQKRHVRLKPPFFVERNLTFD